MHDGREPEVREARRDGVVFVIRMLAWTIA